MLSLKPPRLVYDIISQILHRNDPWGASNVKNGLLRFTDNDSRVSFRRWPLRSHILLLAQVSECISVQTSSTWTSGESGTVQLGPPFNKRVRGANSSGYAPALWIQRTWSRSPAPLQFQISTGPGVDIFPTDVLINCLPRTERLRGYFGATAGPRGRYIIDDLARNSLSFRKCQNV